MLYFLLSEKSYVHKVLGKKPFKRIIPKTPALYKSLGGFLLIFHIFFA